MVSPRGALRRGPAFVTLLLVFLLVTVGTGCSVIGGQSEAADGATRVSDQELVVFAASDLANAFAALEPAFADQARPKLVVAFGSSGKLAQQIERGAPADVFMSADREYVDLLVDTGLVDIADVEGYAQGRLVVWSRDDAATVVDRLEDLADPAVTRIAIANPDHAPYGRAARAALQAAGLWEAVQPKVIVAESVFQAFQYAETGNVDAAIVAVSVVPDSGGRAVPIPDEMHPPIDQVLAVIEESPRRDAAREFAAFMIGPEAQAILAGYGFGPPIE